MMDGHGMLVAPRPRRLRSSGHLLRPDSMNPLRDDEPSRLATTAEAYLTGQLAVCVQELRTLSDRTTQAKP